MNGAGLIVYFGSGATALLFEMLFQQLQRVGVALEAFAGDGGEAG